MSSKDDGGPAFPVTVSDGGPSGFQSRDFNGVTVRDYFAAKALQGMITAELTETDFRTTKRKLFMDTAAKLSYEMADAMMKERAK